MILGVRITHELCDIVCFLLVIAPLVPHVVHTQHSSQNCCPTKIVDSEICTALILVFQKAKASTLSGLFVAHQIDVHGLAVLRKDGYNITLG